MSKHLVDGVPRNEYVKRPDQAAKRKAYAQAHREEHTQYYEVYRRKHPEKMMFRAAKDRAKVKGITFNIEVSDIVIPEKCPVLGIPLISGVGLGNGGKDNSPSLDRIDNFKGYEKGNIQVISHKANSMKFTASKEELITFANWVIKEYT